MHQTHVSIAYRWFFSLLLSTVLSFSCATKNKHPQTVTIDGSSTVYPITVAIDNEFAKTGKNIHITVGVSGTTAGLRRFAAGEIDIANASRPIRKAESDECRKNRVSFIELPIAFDGIAVVVHPSNTWCTYLTVTELKRLWASESEGKVMQWSDIRKGWPEKPLRLFGAGYESGTYDFFTAAVIGTEHVVSRDDFTRSEDDNVLVKGVAGEPDALGFFGLGYYEKNRNVLKLVAIDDENDANGKGPILPGIQTVSDGSYQPLSRPIFIYVNLSSLETKPAVNDYVHFYLSHARKLVRETGYIPLSVNAYSMAIRRVDRRVTGSAYNDGVQLGVSIEDILK